MKIGDKVGRLTIVSRHGYKNSSGNWIYKCECVCECGNKITVFDTNLRKGKTASCGCLYKESRHTITLSHGQRHTRLYRIWTNMKSRCTNTKVNNYRNYGGRGITICKGWIESFEKFAEWAMLNGYCDNLSIDRIDVDGNYEPSNCRWSDKFTQARNKTSNIIIDINGEKKCLKEWCEDYSLPYKIIHQRIKRSPLNPSEALRQEIVKVMETA